MKKIDIQIGYSTVIGQIITRGITTQTQLLTYKMLLWRIIQKLQEKLFDELVFK